MGRLIDIDVLFDYFGNDAIDEITRSNIEHFASEEGTVEAIPKADYENRLKADLVAMLKELQSEIREVEVVQDEPKIRAGELCLKGACIDLIQQKIHALKSESEEK